MGHYCRICGRHRPNERFSGKGHRMHICKECARRPKQERNASLCQDEIARYLTQSHISQKNCVRLSELAESADPDVAQWAALVLEIARVKPHKRRRLKVLGRTRPDLLRRLEETGLIFAHHE